MKQFILFFLLIVATPVSFAANSEIHLKDGSIISGEIMSFDGKIYRIKSKSLGLIELNDTKIDLIRSNAENSSSNLNQPNPGVGQSNVMAIQQQLMSNPDIMQLITSLQNDPQVQSMLSDPKLMQAVMAGDTNALMNNPEFKALMNSPAIQNILNKTQP